MTLLLQAGTNNLNKPSVSPQSYIGKLKEHINDILKSFSNVFKIFLCKVPPRSDKHHVNSKINHFNNLLVDELSNADNIITVETIPLELGTEGRMWVAKKIFIIGVTAQVLYSGSLSRSFDVSQGTGQGRILAPFMYKVYINSLLHVLSDHNYEVCIRSLQLISPSFADDMTLLALHSSFVSVLMDMCDQYSIKWR